MRSLSNGQNKKWRKLKSRWRYVFLYSMDVHTVVLDIGILTIQSVVRGIFVNGICLGIKSVMIFLLL